MKKIILVGSSSAMAAALSQRLRAEGDYVVGISRQEDKGYCDEWHTVSSYQEADLPTFSGSIDGLVYFPGSIVLKPFARYTDQELINDFELNALGAVRAIRKYIGGLKQSVGSGIVLMSTVAVQTGLPFHMSISMAKGALEGLVRSLSAELAPTVRVNGVAPALTATGLSERLINTEEKRIQSAKRYPLQTIGEPQQQADAIRFLLKEATWTTGHLLPVDGGMSTLQSV